MSKEENKPANEDAVLYELGFHLVPTIAEEKLDEEFKNIESLVKKQGGEVTAKSAPALVKLAYTLVKKEDSKNYKYDNAYFSWIKFLAPAEEIAELQESLDLNSHILRYMVVKTENESNIQAEDIAQVLNGDSAKDSEEDSDDNKKEDSDTDNDSNEDESEDSNDTEDVDADTEGEDEKESDDKKSIDDVDKVIDDLVSDEK